MYVSKKQQDFFFESTNFKMAGNFIRFVSLSVFVSVQADARFMRTQASLTEPTEGVFLPVATEVQNLENSSTVYVRSYSPGQQISTLCGGYEIVNYETIMPICDCAALPTSSTSSFNMGTTNPCGKTEISSYLVTDDTLSNGYTRRHSSK